MAFSIQAELHRVSSSPPIENPPSGCLVNPDAWRRSLAIPRDPPFYPRSDPPGGRVFPRRSSSFLSQDVLRGPPGEKTVAGGKKKSAIPVCERHREAKGKIGRGLIEMTARREKGESNPGHRN